jgi:hypothetical protein
MPPQRTSLPWQAGVIREVRESVSNEKKEVKHSKITKGFYLTTF